MDKVERRKKVEDGKVKCISFGQK